ncbi:MAG: helix-hairpin-helix domain-containing protein [Chloroflexi bacterium]|nr:helix-hairpin-helix domain-containing protein [Chloroflexota bacterium]
MFGGAVVLALVAISLFLLQTLTPARPPLQIVVPTPAAAALKVYVSGAVLQPGVYPFQDGDRVDDVLRAAGGPTEDADLQRLNLSTRLHDQMHVLVPSRVAGQSPSLAPAANSVVPADGLINLNTATAEQLDSLPQVGPATVKKIVDQREGKGPFQRIEELLELKIVNASTFELIKGRITAP